MKIYNLSNIPNQQYVLNRHSLIYTPTNSVAQYPDNIPLKSIRTVIFTNDTVYINGYKLMRKKFKLSLSSILKTIKITHSLQHYTEIQIMDNSDYTFSSTFMISPHLSEINYPNNKHLTECQKIRCTRNCIFVDDYLYYNNRWIGV